MGRFTVVARVICSVEYASIMGLPWAQSIPVPGSPLSWCIRKYAPLVARHCAANLPLSVLAGSKSCAWLQPKILLLLYDDLMANVILYIATSLDGFIADKDGGVGWLDAFSDQDYGYDAFFDGVGTIVMGATTFEQSLEFGVEKPYGDKRVIVMTHREFKVPTGWWVESYAGSPKDLVERLKVEAAGDVWLVGGADVVGQFMREKMIDEVRLFIMPVLLSEGLHLWQKPQTTLLQLDAAESYDNDVVELRYSVRG
jgi:dihydrofolate reductase